MIHIRKFDKVDFSKIKKKSKQLLKRHLRKYESFRLEENIHQKKDLCSKYITHKELSKSSKNSQENNPIKKKGLKKLIIEASMGK
jgi:hypothetical protein